MYALVGKLNPEGGGMTTVNTTVAVADPWLLLPLTTIVTGVGFKVVGVPKISPVNGSMVIPGGNVPLTIVNVSKYPIALAIGTRLG